MTRNRFIGALAVTAGLALPASAQAAGYQTAVLASEPLTYLGLDESLDATGALDASANHRDGDFAGGVTLGALAPFDDAGTAAALAIDGTVTATVDEPSRTLEVWVNPNRLNRGQQAGLAAHGDPAVDGWALGLGARRKLAIVTGGAILQTKITLPSNVWTLVTVTWSDKVRVYLNGGLKKQFNGGPAAGNGAFVLGGSGAGAFNGSYSGMLDEVALYGEALDLEAIQAHFAAAHVPGNTTAPSISGLPAVGQTLTAEPGVWTDAVEATRTYQWQRCDADGEDCGDIEGEGARAQSYLLAAEDESSTVQVAVTVTNTYGAGTAISDPTGKVSASLPPQPDPVPDPVPDPAPVTTPNSGSGTSTSAGTDQGQVLSSAGTLAVAGCLRVVAGRKRVKLRGHGVLRMKMTKNACMTAPVIASVKARRGGALRSVRYKLDGKRVKRLKTLKFGARLKPAKLTAGTHTLALRLTPRTGKAKTFKVRLRLAVV